MKKQIWFLSWELIATSSFLALSWIAPTSAQQRRVDLRNVNGDVRFHSPSRIGGWSGRIQATDESLLPGEWLRTRGSKSGARLYLRPRGTGYWQGSNTTSRFAPTATCQFQLAKGRIIYIHNSRSPASGCRTITPTARIQAPGTALFVIQDAQGTTVGVLTNSPEGPVTVIGLRSGETGETVELRAGELASVSIDGEVRRLGAFSLRDFYRNNRLALGLGPGAEHEDFVNQQPDDIREVIIPVREETLGALREQEEERSLDNELLTPRDLEFPLPDPG
ncbi:MAG TPA: hypothetical protein V6D26_19545 [Stenomitos sp.]